MQEHPSKLMYMCKRKNDDISAEPHFIDSAKLERIQRDKFVCFVKFDEADFASLKNDAHREKISDFKIEDC